MMKRRSAITNQKGFALFAILLVAIVLGALGAMSSLVSTFDLQMTSYYTTGRQAFFTAEAGVLHAINVINRRGVQDFQTDIVATAEWDRLYGAASKTLPSDDTTTYTITVAADATDPASRGTITSVSSAPLQAQRVISITLRKGIIADQGALYMAADDVESDFGARDQFRIDGNDHSLSGSLNPSGPVRPGISTRNDTVTQDVKDNLSAPQQQKVTGLGFSLSPLDPSVITTGGPTVDDLEQIVSRILSSNPVVEISDQNLPAGEYGTLAAPQVTHLTNDQVRLNGSMTGVGILIADGELTINGSANFIGWMIIRGATILESQVIDDTLVDGNAVILGSLWTGDLVVQVGGSAIIDFCLECMELADGTGNGQNVPRLMSVSSWQEVL
jgi:hypothetical protein